MNEKKYVVLIEEGSLIVSIEEYDKEKPIREYIRSNYIDHSTAFDELNDRKIDVWVDDEGLLTGRMPVFLFETPERDISGYLVGDIAFLKYTDEGETIGLTEEEAYFITAWLRKHRILTLDTGLLVGEEATGEYIRSYVVQPSETEKHRKSLEDMREMVKSLGGEIIDL